MWPTRGEALSRTIEAEAAIADLYAEALRRWAPTAQAAVLPSLTAAADLPPDPDAVAETQTAWDQYAEATIIAGLVMLWATSYVDAAVALGVVLPTLPDLPDTPAATDLSRYADTDADVLSIVARAADTTKTELLYDFARVDNNPAARAAVTEFVEAQRPTVAATPAVVQAKVEAAIAEPKITVTVIPEDRAGVLQAEARKVLNPASQQMRAVARNGGYQAAGVMNAAILAAAVESEKDLGEELQKTWICVHPDTLVQSDEPLMAARRWHSGLMVTVRTSDDATSFSVTPEHKVLTANRGWVPANDLSEGDDLIKVDWRHAATCPYVQDKPASISEKFDALLDDAATDEVGAVGRGVHLDIEHTTAGDVQVVRADSELRRHFDPRGPYTSSDIELMLPDLARAALLSDRAFFQRRRGHLTSGEGRAGFVVADTFQLGALPRGAEHLGVGATAGTDTLLVTEDAGDRLSRASNLPSDRFGGHAGQVQLVQVVGVDVGAFSGHVFDLQTVGNWFTANTVLVHNCTIDGKTRPSHWASDGARVPLNSAFTVGQEQLRYPGDPTGSAAEVRNCRCRMGILAPDEELPDEVDRHTERLDGRDSVAINRNGRTQAEEIERREQAGNVRARDDEDGIGRVASGGWTAPSEQEHDMGKGAAFATGTEQDTDAETFLTFSGYIGKLGVATSDRRILAADIDLTMREFPHPMAWCKQSSGGHYDSFTVGVVESAEIEGDRVFATGYFLNSTEAVEAADQVHHKVSAPSLDLAAAEYIFTDEDGKEIEGDLFDWWEENGEPFTYFTKAEVTGFTLVQTPAFDGIDITLGERETRDLAVVASIVASVDGPRVKTYDPALFADPKLTRPTAPTMDNKTGRIYGHLAEWGHAIRGGNGDLTPRNHNGYSNFHTSQVQLDNGKQLSVGRLTVQGGHASTADGVTIATARAHYDNVACAFGLVRVGEDRFGIWFSGVPAPGVDPETFQAGMCAPLSGDWRDCGSGLDMIAAHAVNSPGFPIYSAVTGPDGRDVALVASLGPSRKSKKSAGGFTLDRESLKMLLTEVVETVDRRRAFAHQAGTITAAHTDTAGESPTPNQRVEQLLAGI